MAEKTIRLDGVIGDWMNTTQDFQMRLEQLELSEDDSLTVVINSIGGDVIEGWGIYNILKSLSNKVNTRIEGIAASIASLIALAGDTVQMSEVGSFMIHRASVMAFGNSEDLKKQLDTLDAIDETLITVYAAKTGLKRKDIIEKMDAETWFTSKEAKKLGFVDEIINKVENRIAAIATTSKKKNMKLTAMLKSIFANEGDEKDKVVNQEEEEEKEEEAQEEEEEEEIEKEEEEEEEEAKEHEDDEDEEAVTRDDLAKVMKAIDSKFEQLNKKFDDMNNGMSVFVEDKITAKFKGTRSNGQPPVANNRMNRKTVGYIQSPGKAAMSAIMKEIDSKTRNK